ncbi:MAG TPA: hypothetical protein VGM62_17240 [Chthoniobacterales bacterium]|jgi:hypothetical protein
MNWFIRALLMLALIVLPAVPRLVSQEALEIKGDQDSAGPTPIPRQGWEHAEATPKPKKKSGMAGDVQEMSPAEFKRMGLDKLSPAELKTLNEWLKGYKHQAEQQAASQVTEQTKQQAKEEGRAEAKNEFNRNWLSTDKIYSRIQGEFHGLGHGGKRMIIVLEDGTVWKQANEMDRVLEPPKLIQDPPVMVTHSVAGYKMHVIGAGEFWVNPVRKR